MKKTIIALGLVVASTLAAALPPLAQNSKEIEKIVSDPLFLDLLGGHHQLHSVLKTDGGYLFMTEDRALRVDVEYKRSNVPGQVSFELHFFDSLSVDEGCDQSWDDSAS